MPCKLYFCMILPLALVVISVYGLPINQKSIYPTFEQDAKGHFYLSRSRRQSPILGYKNYMQPSPVQPNVVVMTNGVPNNVYRGAPSSSYALQSSSYGAPSSLYGANRGPTVVVNMPDDSYITPVVNTPYIVPSRRL